MPHENDLQQDVEQFEGYHEKLQKVELHFQKMANALKEGM
jgi:chaperonin cofactor prefoldin